MKKRDLALIFGGSSTEHNASLKSFEWVYKQITLNRLGKELHFRYVIFINRDGEAVLTEVDSEKESQYYSSSDRFTSLAKIMGKMKEENVFIFSCLHGKNGEDGRIQGMADVLKIEGAFGEFFSCAISMSKYHMNNYVKDRHLELSIPKTINVSSLQGLEVQLQPVEGKQIVIKPSSLGASIFTEKFLCDKKNYAEIKELIEKILEYDERALVQEFATGTEYSCGCVELSDEIHVLPLVRIDTKGGFFGHKEKHVLGEATEVLIEPKDETDDQRNLKRIAKEIYKDFGFQNGCRFDFIVNDESITFLEANALPGLMENSIFPKMLRKAGISMSDYVRNCYFNAMKRSSKNTNLEYRID